MDSDLMFVIGLLVSVFSLPSIISALTEGRAPRAAAIMVLIGGGLIAIAVNQHPGRYTLEGIPDTIVRVIGSFMN